jgi:OmcA/MtrC family decaheme c-type cytochrome
MKIPPRIFLVLLLMAGSAAVVGLPKTPYSRGSKGSRVDQAPIDFVLPGLNIAINSASISSVGIISVTYTLTDPNGLPLDATGATTPGIITLNFIAAYIPQGQEQYVAYTTKAATGAVSGTVNQPAGESDGVTTQVCAGQYTYTFKTQAPVGFDAAVTTTIGVYGSRNLIPFNLGTNYASATFNFVPNGSPVIVTRDVIRTQSCDTCHYQLAFHGGSRIGMPMCVLCHQPQNIDPNTGNTLNLVVMAHKIHMGSQLPSVLGYTSGTTTVPPAPYEIIGYMNSVNNFSTVIDPADPRRCEVCHSQTTGAAQAKAFLTEPTRGACGACHDNLNFATGANHPGGIQLSDNECSTCHVPLGVSSFDASILGAHVVPTDTAVTYPQNPDSLIAGINLAITGVTNASAGQTPTVTFTLQDNNGNNIPISQTSTLAFTMAGPTTDYGYTSFGSDTASTPGYVTESALAASCNAAGSCTYTFTHAIPAAAMGTYTIGGEARMTVTVMAGAPVQQSVNESPLNPVVNFSVDGSAVAPRRTVVALANCNACHVDLLLHGGLRSNTEYCVLCHNPSNADFTQRPNAVVVSERTQPFQGINFNLLVHRLHDGVNAALDPLGPPKYPYIVVGYMGSSNDFSGTLFPVMSPAGDATYMQDCAVCHVNGSEQNLPVGLNPVQDPQGWIQGATGQPVQPVSSACSGCHVSEGESSHFLANTDILGESCDVCHAAGAAFAVDVVHVP